MPSNPGAASVSRKIQIQVFFDPDKQPAVIAEPDEVYVDPGEVVDIEWVQAGGNTRLWRFEFIGFLDPVGAECEIKIPRVHPNGLSVTTVNTNRPVNAAALAVGEKEQRYPYKIYVRLQRGRDRDTVFASDPEIINRRESGGSG